MTNDAAPTVAAVDCGSNSTRLLIERLDGRPLVRLMRITRLGEGVDAARRLDPDAIGRTITVLQEFRRVMDVHQVTRARVVATSAVRDAANGEEFLDAAHRSVGFPAELLSGEEEGRLSYLGATSDLPPVAGDDVIVDIGGGSTELIVGRKVRGRTEVLGVVSLHLGCVRLTERHLDHDPPDTLELGAMEETIAAELDRADRVVPSLGTLPPSSRLIGLAGTVSTLSMLEQHLTDYDRDRVHHSVLSRAAVEWWCDTLAKERAVERAQRPGMVEGREDVIVGGAVVLRDVMRRYGFAECLVSEADILDGLAASLRDGVGPQ